MTNPHLLLELPADASPEQIKAAYHRKLRQFPAHSHPQEFKAIRSAYETLRQAPKQEDDFLAPGPLKLGLDETVLDQVEQQAVASIDVSLSRLIRLSL
jgi:tRNA(Leu) C34 or U34 (ribose-2'-O)-methylase TrmL